ncbi:CUGBP Elav-like family member 1-B [Babesia sp. Xinjiang]|uniref:CUGBP Elav-like family member 1-B n=1 Tax=Babesia sp. Xinjiang TaxID=462227 RepID=UPI000A22E857|nr:CUGBP Elav-like family member 1-B [Babesia sp. Xinjiang]ORM40553.1 CUGBP Elav-like family member 1-B [Babesia sp. Xinjiang]
MGWAYATYDDRAAGTAAVRAIDGEPFFEGSKVPCKAQFVTMQDYAKWACYTRNHPVVPKTRWQQFTSSNGISYYYNTRTGQTQWHVPEELMTAEPKPMHAAGSTAFGPPGANLFVFHLPCDWKDDNLSSYFEDYGKIVSVEVRRDQHGNNRGFGFVSYDNPHSALQAIRHMNGFSVSGKYLKVQLKRGEERYLSHNRLMAALFSSSTNLKADERTSHRLVVKKEDAGTYQTNQR